SAARVCMSACAVSLVEIVYTGGIVAVDAERSSCNVLIGAGIFRAVLMHGPPASAPHLGHLTVTASGARLLMSLPMVDAVSSPHLAANHSCSPWMRSVYTLSVMSFLPIRPSSARSLQTGWPTWT